MDPSEEHDEILRRPLPLREANHHFVQCLRAVDAPLPVVMQSPSWFSDQLLWYCSACIQITLTLLNDGPKVQVR